MSRDDVAERPGDVLDVENRPSTAPNDIAVTTMEQQAMAMDSAMKEKYFRYPLNDIPAQQWPLFLIKSVVVDDIDLMGVMNMVPHIIVTYFDPRRRKPTRNFEWSLLSEVSAWLTALFSTCVVPTATPWSSIPTKVWATRRRTSSILSSIPA